MVIPFTFAFLKFNILLLNKEIKKRSLLQDSLNFLEIKVQSSFHFERVLVLLLDQLLSHFHRQDAILGLLA